MNTQDMTIDELKSQIAKYEETLRFIHDMVYEDLRVDEGGSSTWQIEAEVTKVLNLTDEERDIDKNVIYPELTANQRRVLVDVLYFCLNHYDKNSLKWTELSIPSLLEIDILKHNGLIRTIQTDFVTYISLTQKGYDLAKTLSNKESLIDYTSELTESEKAEAFCLDQTINTCPNCGEIFGEATKEGLLECTKCGLMLDPKHQTPVNRLFSEIKVCPDCNEALHEQANGNLLGQQKRRHLR